MAAFDNDVRTRLRRLLGPQRWEVQDRLWEMRSVAGDSRLNLTPQLLRELMNNDGSNLAEIVQLRPTTNRRRPGLQSRTPYDQASRYGVEGGRLHGPMYASSDEDSDTDSLSSDTESDDTDGEDETDDDELSNASSDDVSVYEEAKSPQEAGDNESNAGNLDERAPDSVSVHGIRIVDNKSSLPLNSGNRSIPSESERAPLNNAPPKTKVKIGLKERVSLFFSNLFSCTRSNSED